MPVLRYHPAHYDEAGEYVVDTTVTVEALALTVTNIDEFADWTGADRVEGVVNGGPTYVLDGRRPCTERVVGLGDHAFRSGTTWWAERGGGLYQRWALIEDEEQ